MDYGTTKLLRQWDNYRRARGSFDFVEVSGQKATVSGWMITPDEPIDSISIFIDDHLVGRQRISQRDDVGRVFNQVSHAAASGFGVSGPVASTDLPFMDIAIIGVTASGEQYVLQRYYPLEQLVPLNLPPDYLRKRVAGTDNPDVFFNSGADNALQFISFLRKYLGSRSGARVLDWGCGVGRMDRFIIRFAPDLRLTGCDIDADAIAWCQSNLPSGEFYTTTPFPPLPFKDASFDAVIGYSVMTHLPWPVQQQWLAEIQRILVPGGFFITTVHGLFAVNLSPEMLAALQQAEVLDQTLDPALDGVAPEGYYRATFQTPAFTRSRWGKIFEIVDYVEGGISALHDIVGMRRA